MSGKKYKKFLERLKYHSSPTYRCMLYQRNGISSDEFISATYSNKCFEVLHNICGEDLKDYYGDLDIEHFIHLDEANTKLLMLRTGTHDGEGLIREIEKRFGPAGRDAKNRIESYCNEKGIAYKISVY